MVEGTSTEKAYQEAAKMLSAYAKEHPSEQNLRLAEMLKWLASAPAEERTEWLSEIGRKVGVSNLEIQIANACTRIFADLAEPVPDEGPRPHFYDRRGESRRAQ